MGYAYKRLENPTVDDVLSSVISYCFAPSGTKFYSYDDFMKEVVPTWYPDKGPGGHGTIVIDGKIVDGACILHNLDSVVIGNRMIVSFDILHDLFGDRISFAWWTRR